MHLIRDLKPAFAQQTKLSTLAVGSTAFAAVATSWLVTGSLDPSRWLADLQQARQPAVVHLQESHQPAGVGAVSSPTAPPAEPSSQPQAPPPPHESAPPAPSSSHDDDGSDYADD